jgi:hypothetical protein
MTGERIYESMDIRNKNEKYQEQRVKEWSQRSMDRITYPTIITPTTRGICEFRLWRTWPARITAMTENPSFLGGMYGLTV